MVMIPSACAPCLGEVCVSVMPSPSSRVTVPGWSLINHQIHVNLSVFSLPPGRSDMMVAVMVNRRAYVDQDW